MHLRYYLDKDGKRVYTLKNILEDGSYTLNAHPGTFTIDFAQVINSILARFSPDDKYSDERLKLKERHGLLITQQPPLKF